MASGNEVVHRIRSASRLRDYVVSRRGAATPVATDVVVASEDSSRESLPRTAVASGSSRATLAVVGPQTGATPPALQLLPLEVATAPVAKVNLHFLTPTFEPPPVARWN